MPFRIRCPECQKSLRVEERFAGRRATCRRCGAIVSLTPGSSEVPVQKPPEISLEWPSDPGILDDVNTESEGPQQAPQTQSSFASVRPSQLVLDTSELPHRTGRHRNWWQIRLPVYQVMVIVAVSICAGWIGGRTSYLQNSQSDGMTGQRPRQSNRSFAVQKSQVKTGNQSAPRFTD